MNLAKSLEDCRESIEGALNSAKSDITGVTFESSFLKGEYYEKYCDKKNNWLDQHNQIIASFDGFLADLNVCIQNAENRANSWNNEHAG